MFNNYFKKSMHRSQKKYTINLIVLYVLIRILKILFQYISVMMKISSWSVAGIFLQRKLHCGIFKLHKNYTYVLRLFFSLNFIKKIIQFALKYFSKTHGPYFRTTVSTSHYFILPPKVFQIWWSKTADLHSEQTNINFTYNI